MWFLYRFQRREYQVFVGYEEQRYVLVFLSSSLMEGYIDQEESLGNCFISLINFKKSYLGYYSNFSCYYYYD